MVTFIWMLWAWNIHCRDFKESNPGKEEIIQRSSGAVKQSFTLYCSEMLFIAFCLTAPMACRQRKCSETEGFKSYRQCSTVKAVITPPILSLYTHTHSNRHIHSHPLAQTRAYTWAPTAPPPLRQLRRTCRSVFPHMLPYDLRLCEFLMQGTFVVALC